ncbi:MAG: complex I NDUFA9 subunit family protein [Gammaproteobacteria bacterium]|nr:MAG: complex I NDUFA9 subunit family protein [Gammaproteobacteria bacterium]
MDRGIVCILGGTGFVGRHLAFRLARQGYRLRIPSRRPHRHRALRVEPGITLIQADVHDPATLARLVRGCRAVINLVGVLNASPEGFRRVHVELPRKLVTAALEAGVPRLLHMSALNADPGEPHSLYLRTKGEGEAVVHAALAQGLQVTSFRPSVIFGPDDHFLRRFATLLRLAPGVFPLACPEARLTPVYVQDVVDAFVVALEEARTVGRRCALCGPRTYRLRELVALLARTLGLRRRILGLGEGLSRLQARLLQHLPGQPFTMDNYHSLQHPSVCGENCLPELGIPPTALEAVLPHLLGPHQHQARLQAYRAGHHA